MPLKTPAELNEKDTLIRRVLDTLVTVTKATAPSQAATLDAAKADVDRLNQKIQDDTAAAAVAPAEVVK